MSNTTIRFIRAAAGIVVVAILLLTIANWWGDYRHAASNTSSSPTTSTADTTSKGTTSKGATATPVTQDTAVVLIEGLNFRKQPDTNSVTIRGLRKGERLVVVSSKPDWYQVKDAKNVVGWIAAKSQYVRIEK